MIKEEEGRGAEAVRLKALALPLVPCQARAEAGKATSETKPFRSEVRSGKQPGDAQRNPSEGLALSAVFHRRLVLPSVGASSVSHNSEDVFQRMSGGFTVGSWFADT